MKTLPPSSDSSSVRVAYVAMRRAYRIAKRDPMNPLAQQMRLAVYTAGRALTGNWDAGFDGPSPRGFWCTEMRTYERTMPSGHTLWSKQPRVWLACSVVLARWRLEDALAVA